MNSDFSIQAQRLHPLKLSIDDETLLYNIKQRLAASQSFFQKECNLTKRQEKLEAYVKGQQVDENQIHPQSHPYMENLMWEAMVRNRSIIMSRMPDMVVKSPQNPQVADKVSKIIDSEIKRQRNKDVLSMAVMHRPIYFYGVLKAVWRPEKDDYEFVPVNPKRVVFDHTNTTGDMSDYDYLGEWKMESVSNLIKQFPSKKDEIFQEAGIDEQDRNKTKSLASQVKVWEVWFKDDEKFTDDVSGGSKYQPVVGVSWILGNTVLHKMKHPYWDWQGEKKGYDPEIKEEVKESEEDIYQSLFGEQKSLQTIYRNYFDQPEIPYFIITLNTWGEHPIDITSNYEQVIYFQDHVNIEGRQISEINTRSIGKDVYNSEAIDKETAENLDPRDFDQNIVVDGDINRCYRHISHQPAPAQMYKSKAENRSIAFEMMALNATTRGVKQPGEETLGAKQMMREQDFGVLDFEADSTLNKAATWMARWSLQFIKRYYSVGKFKKSIGPSGQMVYEKISRDMIDDGMEVQVYASGVDKEKKKRDAMAMANLGLIDPLTFYEDVEASDPAQRAERLMIFKAAPQMYMQTIQNGGSIEDLASQLQGGQSPATQQQPQQPASPPQAM